MKRLTFRTRVLLYLILFAVVPSSVLMLGGAAAVGNALPRLTGSQAWDSVGATGRRALDALRTAPLAPAQRRALAAHERELATSLTQARRVQYLSQRAAVMVVLLALVGSALLALLASRVAGHLSRQLSRPLHEVVGWTELIARGQPLPRQPPRRGAPEFEILRQRMRAMAAELQEARGRELEAERVRAFRETARRVAHELKNPLTPIRFALERLRRGAPAELADAVDVLAVESARLEQLATSFAQFGRLPEGPRAAVDLAELARYAARAAVPASIAVQVDAEPELPLVLGHHDALARALSNVLLNAVDACESTGGAITLRVARESAGTVALRVRDTGCGMTPEQRERMWEPYATAKPGGTGLGLAIARQTILSHGGTVSATSAPGEGTEITFVLPVEGGREATRPPARDRVVAHIG